jgi:hypothetical protein
LNTELTRKENTMIKLLGIDLFRAAETTPRHEPGASFEDVRGKSGTLTFFDPASNSNITRRYAPSGRYRYVKATGTISAGDAVQLDVAASVAERDFSVIRTTAADQAWEGIAMVAAVAGQFLMIQTAGRYYNANVATPAAGDILGTTTTAGRLGTLVASAANALAAATGRSARCITAAASNLSDILLGE